MRRQDSSLDIRNNLIYMGYYFYGYKMPELATTFSISKQMVQKILMEISDKRLKEINKK